MAKQIKQLCPTCKGSGIKSGKVLKDDRGKVLLAPPYQKGEGDKPQYEYCDTCEGEGMTLQDPPTTIMVDGEKITITPEEARDRYIAI